MKYIKEILENSDTDKFSGLNKLIIKLQLLEFFLIPILGVILEFVGITIKFYITESRIVIDTILGISIWIGSIIAFGIGILSIVLSILGIKRSLGKKFIFILNIIVGIVGLLGLFNLTFMPHRYISFQYIFDLF